jgi:putative oxidoreductase
VGAHRRNGAWFQSLGMRPGWLHAWAASLTDLGAGALLLLGLATPLACAGVVGTIPVAWITNHLRNSSSSGLARATST